MNRQHQLRDALAAALLASTGLPQVYRSPRIPIAAEDLPAVSLYTHSDKPLDPESDHSRAHMRVMTMAVDVQVKGEIEEDACEVLCDLVLQAVQADETLGGLAQRIQWAGQEWAGAAGDSPICGSQLLFEIVYQWRPTNG